ncbi:hypothetical protein DOY81_007451 [Sarcophaga bullata]|nr:hypothetical protein DOY81_007451 [Sarcophaga bullata]
MYGTISSKTLANTTDTIFTEQQYMQNHFNEELKAKVTNLINCRNDKQKHQEHKQQLQCNRQLDYNYEFKTQRIPRVQNNGNDYVNVNTNKGTIIVDNRATTTTTMIHHKNYVTCKMFATNLYRNNWVINRGCGDNVGANCSNCRNIKILLRLSLRYFYDINCEFVKNII